MRFFLFIYFFSCLTVLLSQDNNTYLEKEWLVEFSKQPNISKESGKYSIELLSKYQQIYLISFKESVDKAYVEKTVSSLAKPVQLYPNLEVEQRSVLPNDPLYQEQWNLEMINLPQLWEETQGGATANGEEIVVAVLDDGIDIDHEDMSNNIWLNPGEIPGDNLDNDGNGYVDDFRGVNIQDGLDIHPRLDHGTNVAGIIGAVGDNEIGIAGMNWNCKIMVLSGVTNVAEIIKAFEYVYDMKFKYILTDGAEGANVLVTNFSAGIRRVFPSDFPGWCAMYDQLGSVGVLSVGATANEDFNIDIDGDMPSLCTSDYLIVVTNSDRNDRLVIDVATSSTHVDLAAPGDGVRSLDIDNKYGIISGTSASTPHVAGAIALLYSIECEALSNQIDIDPPAAAQIIKEAIMTGVDPNPEYLNTVSGGRLNVYNSLLELQPVCGLANVGQLEVRSVESEWISASTQNLVVEYVTDKLSDHKVFISNAMGQVVYRQTFNPSIFAERIVRLDNISFPTGIYYITISNGDKVASKSHLIIGF